MSKTVEIPEELYEKFQSRASEKGLDSAQEYVLHILEQVSDKLEKEDKNSISQEQEEKVKDKLEKMGYR